MSTEIGLFAVVLLTSLTLSAALAVLWRALERPRHALTWSLAFFIAAAEAVTTIGMALAPGRIAIVWADVMLALAAVALVATGARQRAGTAGLWSWPLTRAVPAAFVLIGAAATVPALVPLGRSGEFLFAAWMFGVAARALTPTGRSPLPAEWLAIAMAVAFAVFELALGGVALTPLVLDPATMARIRPPVMTIYLVGQASLSVAAGIAVILVIASDLAERLRALAGFDPLTGVANRRGFEEAALRAIADARRSHRPLTLALGDVDHFKAINDRYGHAAGDAALRHVATTLGDGLRGADLVGRVGGEEFAMLLVDTPVERAAEAVERLRASVAAIPAEAVAGALTMSFGVAELRGAAGSGDETLDALVARADRALYAAKAAGRDRVALAD